MIGLDRITVGTVEAMTVKDVASAALAAEAINGIRIVGIDGPGGAGKSTFAEKLGAELGAPVILGDDFLSWEDIFGWWPRFDKQVLVPLLAGEPARYQLRDWESDPFGHSLGDWKTVEWSPIVIVEGIGCTRRESIGKLAYTVWIDTPEAERLRRGIERDGEGMRDLWEDAIPLENEFFAADGTRNRADVIVSGTG